MATKLVKAVDFPVVMYGCESWTIKKAEHWRIDAFKLWCWRRLLKVPWTARRSNQSILKEISPEYSLEGLILKLKLQYFGHLMWRTDSFEKTLMLGKIEVGGEGDDRGWGGWMASPSQWTWVWVSPGSWWWTGNPGMLQSMGSQKVRHNGATELKGTYYWTWCILQVRTLKALQRCRPLYHFICIADLSAVYTQVCWFPSVFFRLVNFDWYKWILSKICLDVSLSVLLTFIHTVVMQSSIRSRSDAETWTMMSKSLGRKCQE